MVVDVVSDTVDFATLVVLSGTVVNVDVLTVGVLVSVAEFVPVMLEVVMVGITNAVSVDVVFVSIFPFAVLNVVAGSVLVNVAVVPPLESWVLVEVSTQVVEELVVGVFEFGDVVAFSCVTVKVSLPVLVTVTVLVPEVVVAVNVVVFASVEVVPFV